MEQLYDMPKDEYALYDIRDGVSFSYGTIPGAVSAPDITERAQEGSLSKSVKAVLFCMHGEQSAAACERLCGLGYDAYSLTDGYAGWLKKQMIKKDRSA